MSVCLSCRLFVYSVLEDRLSRQQVENKQERERLQTLVAKLEAHISQQGRQIEQVGLLQFLTVSLLSWVRGVLQERWQLQQETSRLKAKQTAFEEERSAFLRRIEEEREQLQQAKVGGGPWHLLLSPASCLALWSVT